MIKTNPGEVWKQLIFTGHKLLRKRYAISCLGRVASYTKSITEDGKLLSGSGTSGYKSLNLNINGVNGTIYIHREVARAFCKKRSPRQKFVIHKNHLKTDNRSINLAWASPEAASAHQQNSPDKLAYKTRQANRTIGIKLTAAKVRTIKSGIEDPTRKLTYRQMAAKFKVSEMTIYRIKNGQSWAHIA